MSTELEVEELCAFELRGDQRMRGRYLFVDSVSGRLGIATPPPLDESGYGGPVYLDAEQEAELRAVLNRRAEGGVPRRCETCQWWRGAKSAKNPHGGICALGSWIAWRERKPLRPPAHLTSKAHGTGDMMTAHDFGCVQWEARDA